MVETTSKRPSWRSSLCAMALATALSACTPAATPPVERNFIAQNAAMSAMTRVAVIPFDNLTNHPNAGLIAAQLMTSELYSQGLYQLSEEGMVRRTIAEATAMAELDAPLDIQEMAQKLGVEAVLIGSVSEYGYKHSLDEEPAVGLNVRLVSAASGDVLWAASHSEIGGDKQREGLNQMAQRIIQRMIEPLALTLVGQDG